VLSRGGELLTETEDIVGRWKEHVEELLNPTSTSSVKEAESDDSGVASPISLAEVAEVVKKLFSGKAPGVVEIRPEVLKALDIVGLSWLYLWNGRPGWWSPFSEKGTGGCAPIIGVSQCSSSLGKFIPGCWKGGSGRLSNLSFSRNNVDSILAV